MLQFLAQHRRINSQLLRNLQRQFIAHDPARHPLNVREKMVDGLDFALRVPHRKHCARPSVRSLPRPPAVPGSKLTTTFFENRPSSFACSSVNAVPELAITLWKPAAYTEMQSICPSTRMEYSSLRIASFALSRLNSTRDFESIGVSGEF